MPDANPVLTIHRTIKQGNLPELIELLRKNEELLNIVTPFGTWLQDASSQGQLEIVRWLVTQGLSVNAYDNANPSPPLAKAAARGHVSVVKFLIQSGAEMDTSDSVRNPLIASIVGDISEQHTAVAKVLIDSGIDTKVIYNRGTIENMDALAFAKEWGRSDVVKLLENA